jgi:hypothetical protein
VVGSILFVGCITLATVLLLASLGYAIYLGVLTRRTRTGRVVFGAVSSLKFFVALILADFYLAVLFPEWVQANRSTIRWGLVLYLMLQSFGTLVALERLRRYGES